MTVAFGLRLQGLPPSPWLAGAHGRHWPTLRVVQRTGEASLPPEYVSSRSAQVHLRGDYRGYGLEVELDPGSATIIGPERVNDDQLVHPYVTLVAIVAGRLLGREALHAGAFERDGGAWALLGPPGAGKSTTLAALATAGTTVLADDLVLLDDGDRVLSGPRCLDLRDCAGEGARVRVRGASRWRMTLAPAAPVVPLHGLIYLTWGAPLRLSRVPVSERFGRVDAYRRWGDAIQMSAERAFALATVPTFELARPRGGASLQSAVALLVESPLLAPAATGAL